MKKSAIAEKVISLRESRMLRKGIQPIFTLFKTIFFGFSYIYDNYQFELKWRYVENSWLFCLVGCPPLNVFLSELSYRPIFGAHSEQPSYLKTMMMTFDKTEKKTKDNHKIDKINEFICTEIYVILSFLSV